MLEAIQLTKKFGALTALNSLDLKVGAGEIVCLLGANGAGKTTTINLFLGFLEPTSGEALVNGLNVQQTPLETKNILPTSLNKLRFTRNFQVWKISTSSCAFPAQYTTLQSY